MTIILKVFRAEASRGGNKYGGEFQALNEKEARTKLVQQGFVINSLVEIGEVEVQEPEAPKEAPAEKAESEVEPHASAESDEKSPESTSTSEDNAPTQEEKAASNDEEAKSAERKEEAETVDDQTESDDEDESDIEVEQGESDEDTGKEESTSSDEESSPQEQEESDPSYSAPSPSYQPQTATEEKRKEVIGQEIEHDETTGDGKEQEIYYVEDRKVKKKLNKTQLFYGSIGLCVALIFYVFYGQFGKSVKKSAEITAQTGRKSFNEAAEISSKATARVDDERIQKVTDASRTRDDIEVSGVTMEGFASQEQAIATWTGEPYDRNTIPFIRKQLGEHEYVSLADTVYRWIYFKGSDVTLKVNKETLTIDAVLSGRKLVDEEL